MISFLFLSKEYLKNFIIVTLALTLSASLIDLVSHINSLQGFNQKILYSFYIFEDILSLIYPVSLILGAIVTFYKLISKNYLLSLASFSYTKKRLVNPFLLISISIYILILLLDFTPFAYAHSNAEIILNKNNQEFVKDSFFKYNNSFVYAKRLDVAKKELIDVKIYIIKDLKVLKIIEFKRAKFDGQFWVAKDASIKIFKYSGDKPLGYDIKRVKDFKVLKGYYPKVVKLLYEGKRVSIKDGFKALKLLREQNIDTSKVKSALYSKILTPLLAPLLIIIFFSFAPLHKRVSSLGKYLFLTIGITILSWIILFSLNILSQSSSINPDFILPVAIVLLALYTIYIWIKRLE